MQRRISFLLALGACVGADKSTSGEGADPGPRSGLAETGLVRDLSPADQIALCNWWSMTLGGPEHMQSCSSCTGDACIDWDVSVSTQAACVEWLSGLTCAATVQDAENCAFAQVPDLCASPTACDVLDGC